jgi:hypothetical protein
VRLASVRIVADVITVTLPSYVWSAAVTTHRAPPVPDRLIAPARCVPPPPSPSCRRTTGSETVARVTSVASRTSSEEKPSATVPPSVRSATNVCPSSNVLFVPLPITVNGLAPATSPVVVFK